MSIYICITFYKLHRILNLHVFNSVKTTFSIYFYAFIQIIYKRQDNMMEVFEIPNWLYCVYFPETVYKYVDLFFTNVDT